MTTGVRGSGTSTVVEKSANETRPILTERQEEQVSKTKMVVAKAPFQSPLKPQSKIDKKGPPKVVRMKEI